MAKTAIKQSSKQDTSQILAGGILLTMDDDLRNLQARNSRELRNRKQRKAAKIMPATEKAILSAPRSKPTSPKKKRGFLSVFKWAFKKEKKIDESKKAPVAQKKSPAATLQPQIQTQKPLSSVQKTHESQKEAPALKPLQKKQIFITKGEANDITEKKEELRMQVVSIEKELGNFVSENSIFNEKIAELKKQKQQLEESLKPVLEEEAKLEAEEKVVEARENAAEAVEEKHKFESKRWAIEKQRREQEQNKWSLEEKTELNNKEIKELENNFKVISDKQATLKGKKLKIVKRLEQAELFKKREGAGAAMETIEKQLTDIRGQEKEITQKQREVEQKEEQATTTQDSKRLGQIRWDLEEQRKNIEQKRWNIEKGKKELEQEIKEVGGLPKEVVIEKPKEDTPKEPEENKSELEKSEPEQSENEEFVSRKRHSREWKPVKHISSDEKEELSDKISDEEKQKLLAELSKRHDLAKSQASSYPESIGDQEGKEGKAKVFMPSRDLTKEEIASKIKEWRKEKEDKKKISIIQETAQNYKNGTYVPKSKGPISKAVILQKLSTISPEEKSARQEFLAKVAGRPRAVNIKSREVGGEIVFRPIIKRSSAFQKIFARIIFLILILSFIIAVVWLLYTYIFYNNPAEQDTNVIQPIPVDTSTSSDGTATSSDSDIQPIPIDGTVTSSDDVSTSSDSDVIIPEIEFPQSLIDVLATNILEFSSLVPVSDLLSNIIFVDKYPEGFAQIVFQDEKTQEILSFQDFLEVFEIIPVQGFLENIEEPVTLFVYSTGTKNSFGFVSKVKNSSGLINSVKTWEGTMETDTDLLFEALGKNASALTDKFLTAIYKDEGFRYQTFTKQDFGICYAIAHSGYFIFTTSYDVMQKTLDNLTNNE